MVPGTEWDKFLEEQQALLAKRDELSKRGGPVLIGKVKMPTGEVVDAVQSPYTIDESHVSVTVTTAGTVFPRRVSAGRA